MKKTLIFGILLFTIISILYSIFGDTTPSAENIKREDVFSRQIERTKILIHKDIESKAPSMLNVPESIEIPNDFDTQIIINEDSSLMTLNSSFKSKNRIGETIETKYTNSVRWPEKMSVDIFKVGELRLIE